MSVVNGQLRFQHGKPPGQKLWRDGQMAGQNFMAWLVKTARNGDVRKRVPKTAANITISLNLFMTQCGSCHPIALVSFDLAAFAIYYIYNAETENRAGAKIGTCKERRHPFLRVFSLAENRLATALKPVLKKTKSRTFPPIAYGCNRFTSTPLTLSHSVALTTPLSVTNGGKLFK